MIEFLKKSSATIVGVGDDDVVLKVTPTEGKDYIRGLKGVVGIGQASLTEAQLDNALRCKVKSFVLALDNDEEGQKETERALDLINRKGLMAAVVALPEGYKDPDEVINGNKENGLPTLKIEAFRELVGNPESRVSCKANRLLSKQGKKKVYTIGTG